MNMHQPYSHIPVEWTNEDGGRECLRCGRALTGLPPEVRHTDEVVRPMKLDPAEAAAVRNTVEMVAQALAGMPTDRCTDLDRAQVAVEAMHRRGLVALPKRRRRSPSAA